MKSIFECKWIHLFGHLKYYFQCKQFSNEFLINVSLPMSHWFDLFLNVWVYVCCINILCVIVCMCVCVCWWVKLILFIHIHLIEVHIMETFVSNFVDSSFKHVLHSYDLCLVVTYEYEIGNFFKILYFIG
jgi:hypothetical protein